MVIHYLDRPHDQKVIRQAPVMTASVRRGEDVLSGEAKLPLVELLSILIADSWEAAEQLPNDAINASTTFTTETCA